MRRASVGIILTSTFVAGTFLNNAALAKDAETENQHLDLPGSQAQLLKAQSKYALWLTAELRPETRSHVAQIFTHRFYRQRVNEPKGELIFQLDDAAVLVLAAVRNDGSVLIQRRRQLHFIPVNGPAVVQDLQFLECLAIYPDGLLAEDWSARDRQQLLSNAPVYFVPFDGERLRIDQRVLVVEGGVKRFQREEGLKYPAEPYRHKNSFAWILNSTLHTFDLTSRVHTSVKLEKDLHPSYRVSAFDGSTLVSHKCAFDAMSGKILRDLPSTKSAGPVFAVHNHFGYYIAANGLCVIDLTAKDEAGALIREAQSLMPMQEDDGLTVWDGKQWTHVPWLTEMPRP